MSKYLRLEKFLKSLPLQRWRVSFTEIEGVLGFPLPKSAYTYPAWWANDDTGHSHAIWLAAGWRTEDVDIAGRMLTLVRVSRWDSRLGCMRGTAWVAADTDLTAPLGDAVLAEQGALLSE